jgi:hypothetical protein
MNSKSIRIEQENQATFEQLASGPSSFIVAIRRQLSAILFRSELQKAQAIYRSKRQRLQQDRPTPNALTGLSLEEKLRHGMYRHMD